MLQKTGKHSWKIFVNYKPSPLSLIIMIASYQVVVDYELIKSGFLYIFFYYTHIQNPNSDQSVTENTAMFSQVHVYDSM